MQWVMLNVGIELHTQARLMRLPADKLSQLRDLLAQWSLRRLRRLCLPGGETGTSIPPVNHRPAPHPECLQATPLHQTQVPGRSAVVANVCRALERGSHVPLPSSADICRDFRCLRCLGLWSMVRVELVPTEVACGPPHLVQGALCGARGYSNMGQALAGLQSTVALRQSG